MAHTPRWGTTQEAADILGVDRSTVSRWVTAGKLTPERRTDTGLMLFDLDVLERSPLRRCPEPSES